MVGLDERTGQQRWPHTRGDVLVAKFGPAGDGSAVFLQCDGFAALPVSVTGATVLDSPGTDADLVIGLTCGRTVDIKPVQRCGIASPGLTPPIASTSIRVDER